MSFDDFRWIEINQFAKNSLIFEAKFVDRHLLTFFFFFFFLSGFSFTDTDYSQDSREWEETIFYSILPLPPAHEH